MTGCSNTEKAAVAKTAVMVNIHHRRTVHLLGLILGQGVAILNRRSASAQTARRETGGKRQTSDRERETREKGIDKSSIVVTLSPDPCRRGQPSLLRPRPPRGTDTRESIFGTRETSLPFACRSGTVKGSRCVEDLQSIMRWRWDSLSLFVSLSLSVCLSLYLSVSLCLCVSLFVSLHISPSLSLSVSVSPSLSLSVSVYLSV